jgi:4-amino-4-deoxy-L-arabinose transferase-like glycosyltransferase
MPAARRSAHPRRPAPSAAPRESRTAAPGRAAPALRPWHLAAALAALHVALTLLILNPVPHQGGDNAAYLALARSILEHGSYREMWDPANAPHTQYPPGFPLILAGAMLLGVKPFAGFKVLVVLFSGAAVAISYLWARRVSTPGVAAAVGVLLAVGPGVALQSQLELSDVPFWVFTFLGLWAYAHLEPRRVPGVPLRDGDAPPAPAEVDDAAHPLRWIALGAVGTLCAWMTRSAALPLVLAVAAWLVVGRRWRALGVFAAVFVPVAGGWFVRQATAGGADAYVTPFWMVNPYRPALGTIGPMELLERVWANAETYLTRHLPGLVLGMTRTNVATVLAVMIVLLAAAGWARRLRRPGLAELFFPLYLGLVLVWPSEWADMRFLLPVLPLLLLYAAESTWWMLEPLPYPALAGAAVVAACAAAGVPALNAERLNAAECRRELAAGEPYVCYPAVFSGVFAIADQARGKLPEGAAVFSRKPTLFWAFSGYPSRMYPLDPNPAVFLREAEEAGIRYAVLDRSSEGLRYLMPVTQGSKDRFCLMKGFGNDYGGLARIDRGLPPPPPGSPAHYMYYCKPEPGEVPAAPPS